jgi:phosphoribosylanthranilate isomerase
MSRPPYVKICCISSVSEARLAVSAGASALGLVSQMPSGPGVIAEALIAEIATSTPPPIATFLLTSRQDADSICQQHQRCKTSTIQLVDFVAASELVKLRQRLPCVKLVQVIHVVDEKSFDEAMLAAQYVDALLLDSGNPNLPVKELGGTGRTHNWDVSCRIGAQAGVPIFLAGGLNPGNVAEAIATVRPFGIDLCSGVRTGGALDAGKLAGFMQAVRGAIPTLDNGAKK